MFASACFDAGKAKWNGTTQSYQPFGKKFIAALSGISTYGKTPALSVRVDLENM